MPKLIAFHLPQFHCFPENDKWWGKGFTEWVNVKKAKPIYTGHIQPNVPLNQNYYDLSRKETRVWQAKTAKEYGLYGFCYYHYWFDGKLLMEKPLEALLAEPDIDFPFCLCWANEPWTRAWDGRTSTVIMPQRYGGEKEWKDHFDYLYQFFSDARYIKVDNKPMLVLYRTNNIENCDQMIAFWNEECRRRGFNGIHAVEEYNSFQDRPECSNAEAMVDFEPLYQLRRQRTTADNISKTIEHLRGKRLTRNIKSDLKVFSYKGIWEKICKAQFETNKPVYLGAFVNWDNSPRRADKGQLCIGASPEVFEQYLRKQFQRARKQNVEFIFLNAWNEWAEGAYVEPDEQNGYGYLESIRRVTSEFDG